MTPSSGIEPTSEDQTLSSLPSITITGATPRKASFLGLSDPTTTPASSANTPTSSGKSTDPSFRLLYRGALSLPDSHVLLDGVAFSARLPGRGGHVPISGSATQDLDSPSCPRSRGHVSAKELMYNPLALALESMRGRQSLRFKGTVRLRDVWMDDTGDVYMDIHPFATLSRIYFENILCLSSLVASPHDASGPKRTEMGVRVSLGDTDEPETTDIVIYGETSTWLDPPPLQLSPAATSTSLGPAPLSVRVARITPAPRAPRPDDPTPRQPPAHLFSSTTVSDLGANSRILPCSTEGQDRGKAREKDRDKDRGEDHVLRRAREVMLHLPRSKFPAKGSSKARDADNKDKDKDKDKSMRDAVFRVPELPAKARRKQGQADAGTDVFGTVGPPDLPSAKGKAKTVVGNGEGSKTGDAIEGANKLMLKKLAVRRLVDAGMPRTHPEFKDVYGFVYRGAGFAFRSQLKIGHISPQAAEAVVEAHVKLYVLTSDDTHEPIGVRKETLPDTMDVTGR